MIDPFAFREACRIRSIDVVRKIVLKMTDARGISQSRSTHSCSIRKLPSSLKLQIYLSFWLLRSVFAADYHESHLLED